MYIAMLREKRPKFQHGVATQTTAVKIRARQTYALVPTSADAASSTIWDTPPGLRVDDGGSDGDSNANLRLYDLQKGVEPEGQPVSDWRQHYS